MYSDNALSEHHHYTGARRGKNNAGYGEMEKNMKVVYTNHVGRSEHDKAAKNTNIANAADLAAVEKHNNHDYSQEDVSRMQSAIDLKLKYLNKQYDENLEEVEYLNLTEKVKQIYKEEFTESVNKYNANQKRKDRHVESYYDYVSNDGKTDLCVEGIIQIGEKEDWASLPLELRERTKDIYLSALREMLQEVPGLRLAGASFHANESSPHLHWVAVCVHDRPNAKRGFEKVSSRAAVITPEVLGDIFQTKIRAQMEARIEREFGWTFEDKMSGRNKDLSKNQYANIKLQEQNRELGVQIQEMESRADELKEQIPDWPTYDQEAFKAFRLLDDLKELMRSSFNRHFLFRSRKAEQTLLRSVESLRDVIMTSVAALRGFEAREHVPSDQQRSRIIVNALEDRIDQVKKELRPKQRIGKTDRDQER